MENNTIFQKYRMQSLKLTSILFLFAGMIGVMGFGMIYTSAQNQTEPEPELPEENSSRIDQMSGIFGVIFVIISGALGVLAKFLHQYNLGGAATAQMAQTGFQKVIENTGDLKMVAKIIDKLLDGKVEQTLQTHGGSIDIFGQKVTVSKEQYDLLQQIILKQLGEKVDPNKNADLPRETVKLSSPIKLASARSNKSTVKIIDQEADL